MKIKPDEFIGILRQTLVNQGCGYERIIEEFGQVRASQDREGGRQFTLRDHIRGLVLALLSNQRPWGPIAGNLSRIEQIFFHYDPNSLLQADAANLVNGITGIRCGNRQIGKQMSCMKDNIQTLMKIEKAHGSIDCFLTHTDPWTVANDLSQPGPYKLMCIGNTLALEYLKNVGIRASKPDVHIRRILSGQRLGYFEGLPSELEAYELLDRIAAQASCNSTYLDNLLWIFCATNYGNICGAKPKCNVCGFQSYCKLPIC